MASIRCSFHSQKNCQPVVLIFVQLISYNETIAVKKHILQSCHSLVFYIFNKPSQVYVKIILILVINFLANL